MMFLKRKEWNQEFFIFMNSILNTVEDVFGVTKGFHYDVFKMTMI